MRHSIFLTLAWGFIIGIFISSLWHFSMYIGVLLFIISSALCFSEVSLGTLFSPYEIKQYSWFFLACVFFLGSALGVLRYTQYINNKGDAHLLNRIGQSIEVQGMVVEEPNPKETYTQLVIAIDTLGKEKISPTKVLVFDDPYSKRVYGDRIHIEGILTKPENKMNDTGRTFDYVSYLAKDRIFYFVKNIRITFISSGHGSFFKNTALKVKHAFTQSLDQILPFMEAKLAAGLTIAGKYALPKDVQDEFIRTGTIQVVVLSGYNVTLIADAILSLLAFLPRFVGTSIGAFVIILFASAAGGSATIVRAVIMALIVLLGRVLRRNYRVGRALLVAGVLMLIQNPMLLVFDASFQLSFIATAGLIYATPLVNSYLTFIPHETIFKNVIASTIATQLFVAPFLLYLTGLVSVVALPANVLLFMLIPSTMLLSFITGALGLVFPLLARLLGYGAYLLLALMLSIVHLFSKIPGASFTFSSIPFWVVILVYCIYGALLWRFKRKNRIDTAY